MVQGFTRRQVLRSLRGREEEKGSRTVQCIDEVVDPLETTAGCYLINHHPVLYCKQFYYDWRCSWLHLNWRNFP